MAINIVDVLCCCSWTGRLPATADCHSCGAVYKSRVCGLRLRALRQIEATGRASNAPMDASYIAPTMLDRMVELGLVTAGERRKPSDKRCLVRGQARRYWSTERGKLVLAAALIVEQTRADVAASVARHAGLP